MQIHAFRIVNFRSIVDTGWVSLSPDNLTALVGQNESGKTAVLAALAATFSEENLHPDDVRQDATPPEIWLKTKFTQEEVSRAVESVGSSHARAAFAGVLKDVDGLLTWHFSWDRDDEGAELVGFCSIESPNFDAVADELVGRLDHDKVSASIVEGHSSLASQVSVAPAGPAPGVPAASETPAEPTSDPKSMLKQALNVIANAPEELRQSFLNIAPNITLFDEDSGLLPNKIDIEDDCKLAKTSGAFAVRNFLSIAEIDLQKLVQNTDTRWRTGTLNSANRRVSGEFLKFWSQTIGKESKIQIKCSINHHPNSVADKSGKAYLEFLIEDGGAPLYPQQRSRGTRWFISFFLQMKASEQRANDHIFLLDEPGANLHEKAQTDVLRLLEKIKDSVGVIYSTHSPHLLDEKALYRVIAVERDTEADGFPTTLIGAHAFGAASTDTLSPIYTLMGANLSHQTAIKRKNNVILEELSAQYYLRAFWKLTECEQEVNFLPATGVSNVEMLVNLFLGWGLEFVVLVDDEASGRGVYNKLKRDVFLDNDKWAKSRMYKIADCEGVEDIFGPLDYRLHIQKNAELDLKGKKNSHWAKAHGAAKAMQALQFMLDVDRGHVTLEHLEKSTRENIQTLMDEVSLRLRDFDKY
jgi:hypothetical protein